MGGSYYGFFEMNKIINAMKNFNKQCEEIRDTRAMIELSLDIHNKEMFDEYTNKYKKLISNK